MPELPIACAINASYALPLAVMLKSLRQHLHADFRPVLYLLHTGMPSQTLAAISSLLDTHSIIPTEAQLAGAPRSASLPPEAAFPLLLPELLPRTLERVLFLDADLLVMADVAELWDTPLDDRVLAAVPDAAIPLCSSTRGVKGWRESGIPADAPYFNAGVMLIHLERWREQEITRRVLQYFETTSEPIDFLHQEALNAVLWNQWKPLDERWNLIASRAGRRFDRSGSQAWREPGIVHFAGQMKPWRVRIGGPFNEPYREALRPMTALIPSQPPALQDRLRGAYDRHLRDLLHPVEQYLWTRRLL